MNNVINTLFDEDNADNIILVDENGQEVEFEQIALVEVDGVFYCILKPVDCRDVSDDEAWAFEINEEDNLITLVQDEDLADKVFEKYYEMLDEE